MVLSQEVKATFFLSSLPNALDNIIDNLTTKTDLIFEEVVEQLRDIHSIQNQTKDLGDVAFAAVDAAKAQK